MKCSSPKNIEKFTHYHFKGIRPYLEGDAIQELLVGENLDFKKSSSLSKPEPTILSFQFENTYTGGKREKYNQVPPRIAHLVQTNQAKFVQTSRGGQITFHGPGQLVVYPIFDLLDFRKLSSKCYISVLEKSVRGVLQDIYGVKTVDSENTGVWVDSDNKISSIGCNVRRSITSHGLSINYDPDLAFINDTSLVMCGLPTKAQTSIRRITDDTGGIERLSFRFAEEFAKNLGVSVEHRIVDAKEGFSDVSWGKL